MIRSLFLAKFRFISVSKNNSQSFKEDDFRKLGHDVIFVNNNSDSLPVVYNRFLDEERSLDIKHDFLVLIHSDVKFDIEHFCNHCEEVSEKYDVIGLCGCEKIDTSETPFNWFCGSRKYPEYRWGCVTHGELDNAKSYFSQDRSEIKDHRVACIDGLCIVFGKKALESELRFNEMFMFDFYDSQISFDAILNFKLRLGVIVEESLCHYSVGKSILTDDFLKHEYDFRKLFGLRIPEKVREVFDRK